MALRGEELLRHRAPQGAVVFRFPASRRPARARRRRLAAGVVGLATVGLLIAGGPGFSVQASRSSAPASIVISAGDTLWDLAERYGPPGSDPRAYVDAIERLNRLESAPAVGRRLRLPR